MPLMQVEATHLRVVCDACHVASAEVCAKRTVALAARIAAVPRFRAAGWHNDVGEYTRARALDEARREGSGKWYCPECARRTHL
jgi:hypothetical protein